MALKGNIIVRDWNLECFNYKPAFIIEDGIYSEEEISEILEKYILIKKNPLYKNPLGRTGVTGLNKFKNFGSNLKTLYIITCNGFSLDKKKNTYVIYVYNKETRTHTLPDEYNFLKSKKDIIITENDNFNETIIDDSIINTDNAWLELKYIHIEINIEKYELQKSFENLRLMDINSDFYKDNYFVLYNSDKFIIRKFKEYLDSL